MGLVVAGNSIHDAPHQAVLGGGNMGIGFQCLFEDNVFASVCLETSDAGAFYTCGQAGQGWISRGNVVRGNTFVHVRNIAYDDATVNGVYLDDQISGYLVYNNTFVDVDVGLQVGGGRDNAFIANYFENCSLAIHYDNRGENWQHNDTVFPTGILWTGIAEVHPFDAPWDMYRLWDLNYPGVPVNASFVENTFCDCDDVRDFDEFDVKAWLAHYRDNFEGCRSPSQPVHPGKLL